MARLLLLLLIPLAVVQLAAWWRRFNPALPQLEPPAIGDACVDTIVRQVLFRLHGRATRQFVRLETAIAETLTFPGDRQALEQILTVVCAHAIETTPCGRVLVTACHRDGGTRIAIVDDGTGMPLVHAVGVVESSRETLVLLGGSLETVSRKGVGTTTTILLPASATEPWNATIRNAMADFARVTETQPVRTRETVGWVSEAPPIS
jgi:signal transduction histidine kinase